MGPSASFLSALWMKVSRYTSRPIDRRRARGDSWIFLATNNAKIAFVSQVLASINTSQFFPGRAVRQKQGGFQGERMSGGRSRKSS